MALRERAVWLWVIALGVLWYENSEKFRNIIDWGSSTTFDLIESSELAKRVAEINEDYSTPTIIAGIIIAATWGYVVKILQSGAEERKFNRMDYSDMINISYTYIEDDGNIKIENELEWNLSSIFEKEPIVLRIIRRSEKDTNWSSIALKFQDEQQWWQVYERVRDHPQLLWWKINITQTHARKKSWESLEDIEYIWILTKWPQYTLDQERNLREVEWKDVPHTKAEIRFLPFLLSEIQSAIEWFESQREDSENIDDVINKVCTDTDSNCELTNDFIAYMLDWKQQESLNFKYPTYRKRIVALAHAAREYYHWRPHLHYSVSI